MAFLHRARASWAWNPRQVPGGAAQLDTGHPLARGLQGFWPLISDATSLTGSNHGTLTANPTFTPSPLGGTWLKTGGSGYVNLSNLINSAAVAYTAWIIPTALTAAYSAIVDRSSAGQFTEIFVKSNGKIACYVMAGGAGGGTTVSYDGTGSNTLSVNTPYFVAMTYDSSSGLKGYVNGSQDGSAAASSTLNTGAASLYIGNEAQNAGRNFTGLVSGVRAYDRAISADEVGWLYAEPWADVRPALRRRTYYTAPVTSSRRPFITIAA